MFADVSLDGPEQPPLAGGPARQLIVLLHGLGADGNDLIGLAEPWAKLLPHGHFTAPDAPEPCDMAPMGRQWFSLRARDPPAYLKGVQGVAPLLNRYLDEKLSALGLAPSKLALVGFSQGTMSALYIAFRRPHACAGVLGYSGSLIGGERLAEEVRARPPALLIHGDADEVVPVEAVFDAADQLGGAGIATQWHISQGIGHSIAPDGLAIGGRFLREMVGPD